MKRPFRRERPTVDPEAVTALLEQLELAGQRNLLLYAALEERTAAVIQASMRNDALERRIAGLHQELEELRSTEVVSS